MSYVVKARAKGKHGSVTLPDRRVPHQHVSSKTGASSAFLGELRDDARSLYQNTHSLTEEPTVDLQVVKR